MIIYGEFSTLRQCVIAVRANESDEYRKAVLHRVERSIDALLLLFDNKHFAESLIVGRSILEHIAKMVYELKSPKLLEDRKMLTPPQRPTMSYILNELLGDKILYSVLSAFTHSDPFSLFLNEIYVNDIETVTMITEYLSGWMSVACFDLLRQGYPKQTELPSETEQVKLMVAILSRGLDVLRKGDANFPVDLVKSASESLIGNKELKAVILEHVNGHDSSEDMVELFQGKLDLLSSLIPTVKG